MDNFRKTLGEDANFVIEFVNIMPERYFCIIFPLVNIEFYILASDPDLSYQYQRSLIEL